MSRRKSLQPEVPPLSPLPPPKAVMSVAWKWVVALLFCAYLGLSGMHLVTTPVLPNNTGSFINAPDEPAHLEYIRILTTEHRLPVRGDSTYEWHQPPLYYVLAAPLYALGPMAIRALSILMGALSLGLIFLSARKLFPNDPVLSVLALGIAALLPMREAVTASVGNDVLTELLFSLFLYQLIGAFTNGFTIRNAIPLGLTLGAALMTKATGLLLVPILFAALFLLWRQGESKPAVFRGAAWILVLALVCTAGWYGRNIQLYHELTPIKAFVHEFEGTAKASDWLGRPMTVDLWSGSLQSGEPMTRAGYLSLVANWTFRTFWAAYTPPALARQGIPRFLPPNYYLLYFLLVVVALAGLTRLHFRRNTDFSALQRSFVALMFLTLFLVAASFVGFIWTFFQAQGRYLYPAMLPIALLGALGLRAVFPPEYKDKATGLLLLILTVLSLAFITQGVMQAYGRSLPPGTAIG